MALEGLMPCRDSSECVTKQQEKSSCRLVHLEAPLPYEYVALTLISHSQPHSLVLPAGTISKTETWPTFPDTRTQITLKEELMILSPFPRVHYYSTKGRWYLTYPVVYIANSTLNRNRHQSTPVIYTPTAMGVRCACKLSKHTFACYLLTFELGSERKS